MTRSVALVIVIIMIILMGLLGTYVANLFSRAVSQTAESSFSSDAFYIAEGGLLYILMHEFNNDSDFSDNAPPSEKALGKGTFVTRYENQTANSVDIIVEGKLIQDDREYSRHVRLHLSVDIQSQDIDYVQMCSGGININGNNVSGIIDGGIGAAGDVSYGSEVIVTGDVDDNQGEELKIPAFDWDYYARRAQYFEAEGYPNVDYIDGNLTLSSGIYGIDSPGGGKFYYVTGNVQINNNVTFYGTIIAHGQVQLKGDNTLIKAVDFDINQDENYDTMPVIATKEQLHVLKEDVTVIGLVYALGQIHINNADNFTLTGALVADDDIHINNADNINITYDPSLIGDIAGFSEQTGSGAVIVSQWQEQ
ncbi:MAG: hypothetical protein ABH858_06335 [Candidatus Omnitrophota bacterium]